MDAYSLGQFLREAREANEIEIADAVAKLRIRQPILESFEAGEFEVRGVPEIQIRGLLRIYARFLELDEDHVLLLYDQMRFALEKGRSGRRGRRRRQTEPLEEPFSSTQPLQEIEQVERRSAGCRGVLRLLFLLLFSGAAVAIIVFVTLELVGTEIGGEPSPAADTPAIPPSATLETMPTETPELSSPTSSNRAQYSGGGILVSVLVTQRSWINIQADGIEQYVGIATADTLLEFSADSEVMLSASNALALDVIWNGQRQGQIGERGQRADIRFTVDTAVVTLGPGGEPTPVSPTAEVEVVAAEQEAEPLPSVASEAESLPSDTPGPSPLPTETPVPSDTATSTATLTPLPSNTPIPSATPTPTEAPPPTAILPPRVTQVGLPPTKPGA